MPLTPGERRALTWLMVVVSVGSGVKMIRHWRDGVGGQSQDAIGLAHQIAAVDSLQRDGSRAGASSGRGRPGRGGRRRPRRPDSTGATSAVAVAAGPVESSRDLPRLSPVDIDVADSATLERLPRIGPALAARIVAERLTRGAYGSVEGLQRVRGIGPKLAELLRPQVTFSGVPRPFPVQR